MKKLLAAFFVIAFFCVNGQKTNGKKVPLFNGKNLDGWYSFLGSKGKNNDPDKVFNTENSLLHIYGKEFGYICTGKEYTNFHLAVEFKWGIKNN